MTKELESELESRVRDYAIRKAWFEIKIMRTSRRGFPDRFFAKKGRIVLVEMKREGETARKQQSKLHRELAEHGVEVHTIDKFEQAVKLLGG